MGRPEADIKGGLGGAGAPPQNTCFFVGYGFGFEIIRLLLPPAPDTAMWDTGTVTSVGAQTYSLANLLPSFRHPGDIEHP